MALKSWFLATRPKTWIASISPVLIGSSLAAKTAFHPFLFFCTLGFGLFIQIGTNFANDYFDFIKGADTKERQGPKRAISEKWISLEAMKWGIALTFLMAFLIAIPLLKITGTWGIFLAIIAILSGIFYTAGPKPIAYVGLGEVFVFLFFGPIATVGSYYIQTSFFSVEIFMISISLGLLSSAILIANNLRDEITDRKANKNTLIVRFGRRFGKWEYALCLLLACSINIWQSPLSSISLLYALYLIQECARGNTAQDFIPLLPKTSLLLALYTCTIVL